MRDEKILQEPNAVKNESDRSKKHLINVEIFYREHFYKAESSESQKFKNTSKKGE